MIVNEFDSYYEFETSFRLLNSEIGNDHNLAVYLNLILHFVFVSLTRR